ncbi:MAG: metallophosphoesterase, partial [Bacteroidales bacterium]|nr:metallophosphoesterase [Bacteroidales bacterium]
MATREKTYFVADTHFGAPPDSRGREADFVRWLDVIKDDAKTLFLLGDIFDFWFSYKHVVPRGFVRVLGKLAELADSGVEIHFFTGNHDMWVFDYL